MIGTVGVVVILQGRRRDAVIPQLRADITTGFMLQQRLRRTHIQPLATAIKIALHARHQFTQRNTLFPLLQARQHRLVQFIQGNVEQA
ncbi:hypothetical protein D3C81_2054270 [compost metagenome]